MGTIFLARPVVTGQSEMI